MVEVRSRPMCPLHWTLQNRTYTLKNNCEIVDNAYMFTGLSSFSQDVRLVRTIIKNINFSSLLVDIFFSGQYRGGEVRIYMSVRELTGSILRMANKIFFWRLASGLRAGRQ